MDWLAMTLGGVRENTPWLCPSTTNEDAYWRHWCGEKGGECDKDGGWDWRITAVEDATHCSKLETSSNSIPADPKTLVEQLQDQEDSTAHRVMLIRRSLGALADWYGPASVEAISLARAIEATMDALFGPTLPKGTLTWSIPAAKSLQGSDREPVRFRVELLENGRWKAYSDEIEAALSLWLYSVYEQENPKKQRDVVKNRKPTKDDAWLRAKGTPVKQSLQLLGSYSECLHQHLRWWMPNGAVRVREVEQIEEATDDGTTIEVETHRIVGFMSGSSPSSPSRDQPQFYKVRPSPATASNDTTDYRGGNGEKAHVVLATESYSSLGTLFAQHMFSIFMRAAVKNMAGPIPGGVDICPTETGEASHDAAWHSFTLQNNQLSKMAQDIHSTGLGSLEEVYQCIIPPLSGEDRLPCVDAIIEWTRKYARPHEQRGHWKEAADVYLWHFRTARKYLQHEDIVAKATALLMECLNAVTDVLKIRKAQQLGQEDTQELEQVKSILDNELRNADVDIVTRLLKLYKVQGRSWGCSFIENTNPLTGEDKTLKFTGLHWMAHKEDWHLASHLNQGAVGIDEKDILDWTPLHYAAAKPCPRALSTLLKYRANVNGQDAHGRTPLHYACRHGDASVMQSLLRGGAKINTQDIGGMAPIHYAAMHGSSSVLESLIEAGADINFVDNLGCTALLWAISKGHTNIVRRLWRDSKTGLRNHNGRTGLHLAAIADVDEASKRDDVVRVLLEELLEKGAAIIESKDRFGRTPLHLSARSGHEAVVELLLDRGATIDVKDGEERTPLHWAANSGHKAVVELLLDWGATIDMKDSWEWTPLYWAAKRGHEAVVKLLLDRGATINAKDGDELTPLHLAANSGHKAVVELLLDRGATIDAKDGDELTPLHLAADSGHKAVVELLLDRGATIDAKDGDELTPLHRAADSGHKAVVKLLLDRGATTTALGC